MHQVLQFASLTLIVPQVTSGLIQPTVSSAPPLLRHAVLSDCCTTAGEPEEKALEGGGQRRADLPASEGCISAADEGRGSPEQAAGGREGFTGGGIQVRFSSLGCHDTKIAYRDS